MSTYAADRGGSEAGSGTATEEVVSHLAMQMGLGFVYHDRREREAAVDAFAAVDRIQFAHADEESTRRAAEGYVDALWEKDRVERAHEIEDGTFDRAALAAADWSPVRDAFSRRAAAVGIDERYADASTAGWRAHKTREDYWTPLLRAQLYELRTVFDDPEYPHKPRYGQSGFGPEAVRYLLGVELHDMRRFEEGYEAMKPYFRRILETREPATLPDV